MNITQLIYFINIVSYDFNISRAANKLHISQSTVSKAINSFENQENVKLFTRHGRRILGLTVKGKEFYRNAKKVVRDYEKLLDNVHSSTKIIGKIKIGVASAVYDTFFPRIIISFKKQHPNIKIDVTVSGSEKIQDQLVLGKLDLAYIVAPIKYNVLKSTPLVDGTAVIVYNPKFFTISDNISIDELSECDMVLLNHSFTLRNQIDAIFSFSKKAPKVIYDSNSENFLVNACRSNSVITILPEDIIYGYNMKGLQAVPFRQVAWELLSTTSVSNSNPITKRVKGEIDDLVRSVDKENKQIKNNLNE